MNEQQEEPIDLFEIQNINSNDIEENVDNDQHQEINTTSNNEITVSKTQLILCIRAHQYSRFTPYLLECNPNIFDNLNQLSEQELQERLDTIKLMQSLRQSQKIVSGIRPHVFLAYENLTQMIGLQTQGLTNQLFQDDNFLD